MTQPPTPPNGDQPQPDPHQPPQSPPQQFQGYHAPREQNPNAAGFFRALFDFSFRSFVTIKFAAIIYGIALLLIGILALVGIIVSFITMTEEPAAGLLMLLLVLVAAPFYLILIRLTLELYVSMIRTAQNTAATTTELENLRRELAERR
ncbi:DUF4282 domain-containing protein [Nesterenkonia sphaerica]|uniref:DUF4282 domain-containing protein n=1 Tax=Nesterenkonia sphaerica TaxID=1804988 RepID=A0A5R9AN59_9MICC|nr:DUF4282 domain-containing protein [Nesterenkonia sphaerica]TLP80047.1 DUF4282 domain-containing protein [Nesterenkonia sphaerica]